jgi:hypothetical protein
MKTFFWGFLSSPWKRLIRTISTLIILIFITNLIFNSNDREVITILSVIVISIPILSYLIEPFVKNEEKEKVILKSVTNENQTTTRNREDLKDEDIKEVCRRILDEIKKKESNHNKVENSQIHLNDNSNEMKNDDDFDYQEKTRVFRKLKIEIKKEFPRNIDSTNNTK